MDTGGKEKCMETWNKMHGYKTRSVWGDEKHYSFFFQMISFIFLFKKGLKQDEIYLLNAFFFSKETMGQL